MATTYAGRYGDDSFTDRSGRPLAVGTSYSVYDAGTNTLATLYDDRDRSNTVANPTTVGANGNAGFYAEVDYYDIEVGSAPRVRVKVDKDPDEPSAAGGGAPSGPAGGVLSGTYPNPGFATDMATQAELDAEATARAAADTTNANAVSAEATTRGNADTTLQTNITNEATARASGDTTNANAITAEATARANADNLKEDLANKSDNTALGNSTTLYPTQNAVRVAIDTAVAGGVKYKGTYNASTNTPSLTDGTGSTGDQYKISVAGTRNFGSGAITFEVGDYVIYNGAAWEKVDTTDQVTGVFGRQGNIVAANGDYTASQVTNAPAGNIAATTVQAALNELDSEKETPAGAQAKADAKVVQTITDGATTTAPSENAVFDALAAKLDISSFTNDTRWMRALAPTAVKTANYTAAANDFVLGDTTSSSFTVTLPTAPADKSLIAIKQIIVGVGNSITVACGGSDRFNRTGGATSFSMPLNAQATLMQYQASTGLWLILADDLPLSTLDARFGAVTLNSQVANYTLVLADAVGKYVRMTVATANTLTVPLNSSVAFPVGTKIDGIQSGAGQTTITPTGGVTLNASGGGLKTRAQYSGFTLVKVATDTWDVLGDLTT